MADKTQFDVPILFILFKRKDEALRVLAAIAKVKPRKLYISQDGPRNKKEKGEVQETREAILSKINWNCDLTVWTHEKNLGIKKHIPAALDKFFAREEYGIYLEDDTLPSPDFFYFQKKLLEKYKNDKRIFSINATNFYPELVNPSKSYYLSKIGDIWGFGLWKRSWKLYDPDMKDFNSVSKTQKYKSYFFNSKYKFYLETFWKAVISGRLDSWAMQLIYTAVKNNMYFLAPKVNMVNNIGVANRASHLSLQKYYKEFENPFPLKHPTSLEYDRNYDVVYFDNMLRWGWLRILLIKAYFSLPGVLKGAVDKISQGLL